MKEIRKSFGEETVLDGLDFSAHAGSFHVLFGPPGSGKSVLLRMLVGLEAPDEGRIFLRERDVTQTTPGERRLSYVPQSFALYPHYTVFDNIAYPLSLVNAPDDEIEESVHNTAAMLEIDDLLDNYPDTLSGGEKQRVAIARGMVKKSGVYIFDDPLAGLDFKLREQLVDDLKAMQSALEATFIYTTTDPLEALVLADEGSVLGRGRVLESGPIDRLYWRPKQRRTMELLGFPRTNFMDGTLSKQSGEYWCRTDLFRFPAKTSDETDGAPPEEISVGLRPHDLKLDVNGGDSLVTAPARVRLREDLGAESIVYLELEEGQLQSVIRSDRSPLPEENDEFEVGVDPSTFVLFEPDEGRRIGQGVSPRDV